MIAQEDFITTGDTLVRKDEVLAITAFNRTIVFRNGERVTVCSHECKSVIEELTKKPTLPTIVNQFIFQNKENWLAKLWKRVFGKDRSEKVCERD